jgi:hypothetical protein
MNITSGLKANGSTGSSGQVLTSSGGGAMTWTTPSSFSGDIADYITHTGNTTNDLFGFPGINEFKIRTDGIDRLNVDSSGNLTIPDYIRHSSDTDTYFGFPSDDTVSINTNGTERFRITSGGNIGIGTTTPSYPLHVIGKINLTSALCANGFFGSAGQVLTASGGGGVNTWTTPSSFSGDIADYITHTGNTTNDLFGFPGINEFKIRTDGIDRLNVDSSGNLTIPDYIRHSSDTDTYVGFPGNNQFTIRTNGIDRLNIDSTGILTIPDYIRHSGDTDTRFGFMTNDEFVISTNGIDRFKILGTGYVGIGTTTPGAPLQIAASGSANPFDNGLVVRNSSNSSNQDAIVTLRVGGSSAGDPFISFDIQNESGGGWAFGVDNSDSNKMKWSTDSANLTTTKMTLTTGGDLGIGTTSPSYKLDVNGTMHIGSALYVGTPSPSAGSSGQVLTSTGGGAMAWTTVSSGSSSPWTVSGSDIYRSSGKVGIGTSTPVRYLDVDGSVSASSGGILIRNGDTNTASANAPQITFGWNGNDEYKHFIRTRHNSGSADNSIDFYVCNGTSNNSLTSGVTHNLTLESGNVGIGTTSPSYKLDVNGTMNITSGLRANGSSGSNGQVLTSSGGGAMTWSTVSSGSSFSGDIADYITHTSDSDTKFGFSANDTFVINTSGAVRFLVNSAGEGTIGQNTVMGSGHMFAVVDGSTSNDGSYADLVITNMSEHNNARLLLGTSHNTTSSSAFKAAIIADGAGTYSRNDLHFCLEGSTDNTANADLSDSKMCIMYSTGNVGIGTTSPSYKLHVNGTMNVTSALYANGSAGTSGQVLTSGGGGTVSWTTVSGGGSSPWTTSGSDIIYNTGNVAIGSYIAHDGDSDAKFGFPTTDTFTITLANIERLRINSSGEAMFGSSSGQTMGTGHKMTIVDGSTGSSSSSYADLVITNRNENNKARILLGTPYNTDSSSAFKAAIIADGAGSSSRCDLHFCLENTSSNTPNADISDSKMVIKYSTGNVGIGTTSPAHKFHVVGDIYASGNVTAYSDARNKKNLKTIEDPVSKIEKINGYTYEKDGIAYTGLVAQELLEVLPEAVCGSEELGYGIAYGNIAGIFVEAIKELNSKIKALENKLSQFV